MHIIIVFFNCYGDNNYAMQNRALRTWYQIKNVYISAIIVIGSVGFIRNTAISMYRAAAASDKFSFEDYLIIGIPATLWPKPSYKAEDILQIHDNFVKSSDDETAKLAFRVGLNALVTYYVFTSVLI